jgi:hypothetical protein
VWQKGLYSAGLLTAVRERAVGNVDRWAVLVDYRALAQVGVVSSADVLALLRKCENKTDLLVAGEIVTALVSLWELFEDSRGEIGALAKVILSRILSKIGREAVPGENENVKPLRSRLIGTLVFLAGDGEMLDPNLLSVTFRAGARYCDGFEQLLALARTDPSREVKARAPFALEFAPPERKNEVLRIGLAAPHQDVTEYLIGVASNPESGRKMWDFVRENWATIDDMFGMKVVNIPSLPEYGTAALKTVEDTDETERWFAEFPSDIGRQVAQEVVEIICSRAALLERDRERVADYLAGIE